jgi:hypothetical protein
VAFVPFLDCEHQVALRPSQRTRGARRRGREVEPSPEVKFERLNEEEKGDIVSQAIEELQMEIAQMKTMGNKDISDIGTLLEEVEVRMTEVRKDTWEFKRDVIIGAEDPRTGRTSAEKVLRCGLPAGWLAAPSLAATGWCGLLNAPPQPQAAAGRLTNYHANRVRSVNANTAAPCMQLSGRQAACQGGHGGEVGAEEHHIPCLYPGA